MSRIGLVLGAGGIVGHAFHAGVLAGLEKATGYDPRCADVIVGTSAGSLVAALLRAGFSTADLEANASGRRLSAVGTRLLGRMGSQGQIPVPSLSHADFTRGPAAASVLLAALRRPWSVRLGALAAGLLPAGTVSTDELQSGMSNLFSGGWPALPTWICAVRLDDGSLTTFGRSGAPAAGIGPAVAASCAIPAFFRPVEIGGRRYVDGGSHSVTNADLLAAERLDLVIVSCPMAATRDALLLGPDLPLRAVVRMRLGRELESVRASGAEVVALQPNPAVRAAMGNNAMDGSRRREVAAAALEMTLARLREPQIRARLAVLAS